MSLDKLRRNYLSWEGLFRCGKTTQKNMFEERLRDEYSQLSLTSSKEPGGDEIADVIRSLVQGEIFSKFSTSMTAESEAMLYSASRGQTVPTIAVPALKRGDIFSSDRSALTSIAYQGAGRDLGMKRIFKINDLILNGFWPGLGIVIDTDLDVIMGRAKDVLGDKFEAMGMDFLTKARDGYMAMGSLMRGITKIEIVDGNGSREEVHDRVWSVAIGYLGI